MLKIETHKENGIIVVTLAGAIDAFSCQHFEESFNQLIELENYKLIIDLSNVNYMTAVGAGIFMAVNKMAEENNGSIVVINPKPVVSEIFSFIGLNKTLTIVSDKEAAIRKFGPGGGNNRMKSDDNSLTC